MKVKYIGSKTSSVTIGKEYIVLEIYSSMEKVFYRIIPDDGDFCPILEEAVSFEIIDSQPAKNWIIDYDKDTMEVIMNKFKETVAWNFGDGSDEDINENPSHTYLNPGTYEVMLKATHDNCESVSTKTIAVTDESHAEEFAGDILATRIADASNIPLISRVQVFDR